VVGEGKSQIGGGTLPRSVIPSITIDLKPETVGLKDLAAALRSRPLPVIGYVAQGRFKLDLRTIFPHQDQEIICALRDACTSGELARTN